MPSDEHARRTNHGQEEQVQAARNEAYIIVIMAGFGVVAILLSILTFFMGGDWGTSMPGASVYIAALGLGFLGISAMKYHNATGGDSDAE